MWPTLGVKFIFALVICTEMHIYVRAEWNSSDTTDFQTKPEQQTYGLYIERLENVIQKQSIDGHEYNIANNIICRF